MTENKDWDKALLALIDYQMLLMKEAASDYSSELQGLKKIRRQLTNNSLESEVKEVYKCDKCSNIMCFREWASNRKCGCGAEAKKYALLPYSTYHALTNDGGVNTNG